MDDTEKKIIGRLKTVDECRQLIENIEKRKIEMKHLLPSIRKKAATIGALQSGATSEVEIDLMEVLLAQEEVLFAERGRNDKRNRTRAKISRDGIIAAADVSVQNPKNDGETFEKMAKYGLPEMTFESVVVRYPSHFTPQAVLASAAKLKRHKQASGVL